MNRGDERYLLYEYVKMNGKCCQERRKTKLHVCTQKKKMENLFLFQHAEDVSFLF